MKTRFLFPYQSRIWGCVCIFAFIPVMVFKKIVHHGYNHQVPSEKLADASGLLNTEHVFTAVAIILVLTGLLLIAFSKERIEDEQIAQLRLDSLQWATYFNFAVLIIFIALTSNIHLRDMMMLNLWAPLVFFIIRFRFKIYQLNQSLKHSLS